MKLSQKSEYGLLALLELSKRFGQGPVQAATIADEREIPAQYLQQILLALRRAGLVHSERGPRGGHELARPPAEVTLLDAILALEGSTSPAACADQGANCACTSRAQCVLRPVWQRIDQATQAILRGVTLTDLARQEDEQAAIPDYQI